MRACQFVKQKHLLNFLGTVQFFWFRISMVENGWSQILIKFWLLEGRTKILINPGTFWMTCIILNLILILCDNGRKNCLSHWLWVARSGFICAWWRLEFPLHYCTYLVAKLSSLQSMHCAKLLSQLDYFRTWGFATGRAKGTLPPKLKT